METTWVCSSPPDTYNLTTGKENVGVLIWARYFWTKKENSRRKVREHSNKLYIVDSNFSHYNTNVWGVVLAAGVEKRQCSFISIVICYSQAPSLDDSEVQTCWLKNVFKNFFKTTVSSNLKHISLQSLQSSNTLVKLFLPLQADFLPPPPSLNMASGLGSQGLPLNHLGMILMTSYKVAGLILS